MDPVNPVLPGEGRWLTGDASARASEEAGVQWDLTRTLKTTFQLSQIFFGWKTTCSHCGRCVLADVLFICGRVGTVDRRSHEKHQFNCGSTSNFCF